jgi:hypothetical protein
MLNSLITKPLFFFGVAGALVAGAVGLSVYEQNQWNAFAAQHECKVVGKIAGYSTYGYYNGKYQTYWVPSKTTYRCNDGIDYTR